MIFGGLEFIAGGYLIHRHYKHKEKQQAEDEAEARRRKTFPGPRPATAHPPRYGQYQCQQRPPRQHHQHHQQHQQQAYKQPYYAPMNSQAPHQGLKHPHHQHQPRPNGPQHAQTFNIPRRPLARPAHAPQIITSHPSGLHRTDSFSSLSHMPVANGSRPHDVPAHFSHDHDNAIESGKKKESVELAAPTLPTRHGHSGGVYANPGFSYSTPAFGATATSPGLTYTFADHAARPHASAGGQGAESGSNRYSQYAPSIAASTELGERGPPPPYEP